MSVLSIGPGRPRRKSPGAFRRRVAALLALLAALVLGQADAATVRLKLNSLGADDRTAGSFQLSPDERYAVYSARPNPTGASRLYSVPIDGGTPVPLSMPANAGYLRRFAISSDGQRVVYLIYSNTGSMELYSVPIDGGTPVRLDSPSVGEVSGFSLSDNGRRVVFDTRSYSPRRYDLYSAPITGGQAIRLSAGWPDGELFSGVSTISPDSRWVVYPLDADRDGLAELYGVPIEGGAHVRLDTLPGSGSDVSGFLISPDSQRVVYRADRDDFAFELYSVPIGGGAAVKLNGELGDQGTVGIHSITADSRHVVYRAQLAPDYRLMLYSTPIGGGPAVQLSPASGSTVRSFMLSKSGDMVVYSTYASELYSVPAGGAATVKLDANGVAYWFNIVPAYHISADGRHVLNVQYGASTAQDLYRTPIDGGPSTLLAQSMEDFSISRMGLAADGATVIYGVTLTNQSEPDYYEVPLAGGPARRIGRSGTTAIQPTITRDGSRLVYIERLPDGRADLLASFEGVATHLPLVTR